MYHNNRLALLDLAGTSVIGGVVGSIISDRARQNQTGFSRTKLHAYDLNKIGYTVAGENAVGCDGKNEGEYYASKITGGSSVIVSWFDFDYKGNNYRYRTTFEVEAEGKKTSKSDVQNAVQTALESSISNIAAQLQ